MLTDEEKQFLKDVDARLNYSDKGPWKVDITIQGSDLQYYEVHRAATMPGGGRGEGICEVYGWGSLREGNAEFVAHARTDIPRMRELIDRLEQENANLIEGHKNQCAVIDVLGEKVDRLKKENQDAYIMTKEKIQSYLRANGYVYLPLGFVMSPMIL